VFCREHILQNLGKIFSTTVALQTRLNKAMYTALYLVEACIRGRWMYTVQ
jgi:hypothetical protein